MIILVNLSPKGGNVSASPSNGTALATLFTLTSQGWTDSDLPLAYQYKASRVGQAQEVAVRDSSNATSVQVRLGFDDPLAPLASRVLLGFPILTICFSLHSFQTYLPSGSSLRAKVVVSDSLGATSTAYSTSIVVHNITNTSSVVAAMTSTLASSTSTLTGTTADTLILQASVLSQAMATTVTAASPSAHAAQVTQVLKVTAAIADRVNLTIARAEQLSQTYQTLTGSASTTTLSPSDLASAARALASLGHRAVSEVKTFSQAFGDAMISAASNVIGAGALSTLNTYTTSIQANLDTTVDRVASLSLGTMAPGQASQSFTATNCRKCLLTDPCPSRCSGTI